MSALLYYSISSDLTEDEIIEVDRRVAKNREAVYLFFRELPSNSKPKVKRLFHYGMFLFQLSQPLVPYASSVMFPPPTGVTNIERIIDYEIRQGNNLENDQNSGKIIVQTGSVKILEVNNSSISYQDDELDFLESTTEDIILAKDTSSTGSSIFAEGFTAPLPQKAQKEGGQTTTGLGGSNPGNGSGGSFSSDSLSNGGICQWNRPAKVKEIPYNLQSAAKTKQQKALEKKERELKESIEAEKELNADREKLGKSKVIVMIKDGRRFFATHDQLRDKFHHASDLGSPIPKKLGKGELTRVANPNLHQERLRTFRNREILPEAFVSISGRRLRSHVLDGNTKVIEGTLGANREARCGAPKTEGYHLYNDKTGLNVFFDKSGKLYRTGFILNDGQAKDIRDNRNIM